MILTLATSAAAYALGALLPVRRPLWGFLAAAAILFCAQATIRTAAGFSGSTIEESLLLFNGSWASYIGFNLQLTLRAFALPLLVLSSVTIWRLRSKLG